MADNSGNEELLLKEIADLKAKIIQRRKEQADTTLRKYAETSAADLINAKGVQLQAKRVFKGHMAKIYSMQWSEEPDKLQFASASLDGWVLVWDAPQNAKLHLVTLKSTWVMACGYHSGAGIAAAGGLDNTVTLFSLRERPTRTLRELVGHDGFISCIRFLNDKELISAAGDHTCILWNVETGQKQVQFKGHSGELSGISLSPDGKCFVSGSADHTAKLWDIRSGQCVITFLGHQKDVNSVSFFPSGTAVATSSEDTRVHLWDLRSGVPVAIYGNDQIVSGCGAVACSKGGKYIFAGYDDNCLRVWDTVKAELVQTVVNAHTAKISTMGVSADGSTLCTGSWDFNLKAWC